MKTITIMALFVIIFSCFSLPAQKTRYGISAGIDFTNVHRTEDLSKIQDLPFEIFYENLLSYHINGFFEYRFSEKFGGMIEPGYIRKGDKIIGNSVSFWNYDYINLPLSIKYFLRDNLGLTLGSEISYLSKLSIKENNEKNIINLNHLAFKKIDLGLRIGANLEVSKNIGFSINFNRSILPFNVIYDIDQDSKIYESKQYHQYLQFAFKYYLR